MKFHRRASFFTFLLLFLLTALAVVHQSPSPTDSPLLPLPTASLTTAASPLAERMLLPTATRDPRPPTDPAPMLLERHPARGQEAALDEAIQLRFDQAMDQASVDVAFHVSTAGDAPETVPGRVDWLDDATLRFTPWQPLERDARYRVRVEGQARSKRGLALQREVAFEFATVGYLQVSQVIPAPGTADVEDDASITVMFNRPVVPLMAISDPNSQDLPHPLTLMRAGDGVLVEGHGEWLNTSIYVFQPERPLESGQLYEGRVEAGLSDVTGGVLAQDYSWSFAVTPPYVVGVWPKGELVEPTAVISVTFSQPMDHASVEEAFRVWPGHRADRGVPLAGAFRWNEDSTTVGFKSATPLPLGERFTAQVEQGARAASGSNARLRQGYDWRFKTVPYPRIVETQPADGERQATPWAGLALYFSAPIVPQTVMPHVTIVPTPTQVYTYWNRYDHRFGISYVASPATSYTVTIAPGISDPYGNTIDETTIIRYTTRDLEPEAWLKTTGWVGVYNGYVGTELFASHRNVSRLDLALYSMPLNDLMRVTGSKKAWDEYQPDWATLVRQWVEPIKSVWNQPGMARLKLAGSEGGALPPGIYFLEMSAPETRHWGRAPSRHVLVVSKTQLTLKLAQREALVWATDLQSGQPVPGLPLRFGDVKLTTDAGGVARFAFSEPLVIQHRHYAVVQHSGLPYEDNFAIALSDWDDGMDPWYFGLDIRYQIEPYNVYFYTDRPIYRPGQPVYFKGVVRLDDDARYDLPRDLQELQVKIHDGRGKLLYDQRLPLSDMGTLDGQFMLDQEASLGSYYLSTSIQGIDGWGRPQDYDYGVSFRVAEYRKPDFQVSVTTDRDQYLHCASIQSEAEDSASVRPITRPASGTTGCDAVKVVVQASYFFGGPVANADVRWALQSNDHAFRWGGTGRYDWGDYDAYRSYSRYRPAGRHIADGQGVTDAQGRLVFSIPANIATHATSQRFTIEATVTDLNYQSVSGSASAIVHKGEFYLGLHPRRYVGRVGEALAVDLRSVDWDGEPWPEQALNVSFYKRTWYSVRESDSQGRFYWSSTYSDTLVLTDTLTTDGGGLASARLVPEEGGRYLVRAVGRDSQGNEVRSSTWMWASSGKYVSWRMDNHDRIDLIVDRDRYEPGETATVLIPSPFQGQVRALLTVERGRILYSQVITLTSNSEVVGIPVTPDMVPNAYVSVFVVKGVDETNPLPAFKVGYATFAVSAKEKELKLTLTPDKDMAAGEYYTPHEHVTYEIRATDYAGNPVRAEISLNLTDLAVLSLAEPNAPSLMDFFYGERGLGVRTATGLTQAMDRYNEKVVEEFKGGGGGVVGDVDIRRDFPDTPYWAPTVHTDADGRATVQVELPDSLTTWRLVARAVTANTWVGEGQVDVISSKDLLIRPLTPRFLVVGDRAQLAAIVHNNTAEDLVVRVTLSASGLDLEGHATQRVEIPSQGKVSVAWMVRVPAAPGEEQFADLTFLARGGGYSDATKPTLGQGPDQLIPIYKYSAPEVVGTAGDLEGELGETRMEAIILPPNVDTTQGELTVEIEPSLAAGMTEGMEYLRHYPYECTEQTVSRFLPNVLTYGALKELVLADPALEANLRQQVAVGLQRLYNQQHTDGGWGWWLRDKSHPTVSAWVVFGLVEARQAGFAVDENVVKAGMSYLRTQLIPPGSMRHDWQANRQAFILYVLAEAGDPDVARTATLFEHRARLSHYARAYLALTFYLINPDERSQINTLLSDLNSAALLSATGAHWEESRRDWWNWNTDTRSTAVVLDALARLDPHNALAPSVVRWLMVARTAGRWETTQETAWALIALTDWMAATGELQADYTWGVQLNGDLIGRDNVTRENVQDETTLRVEIADLLQQEVNRLVIEKGQGPGRLYYMAHLRTFLPVEEVEALNRGIIVGREYTLVSCDNSPRSEAEGIETESGDREGCAAIDSAQVGETVRVRLTLVAPNDLHYVVVEDPIPAGAEAVDTSLKTSRVVGAEGMPDLRWINRRYAGWGWWWFSHTELRDEKALLFATYLPAGTYEYTYLIRLGLAGEYRVLPTTAYEMYFPEVFGRGDGELFTIEE